jgi:hypothetical protein
MKIILFLLALVPFTASAQLFDLKVTDYGVNCSGGVAQQAFCNYIDTQIASVEQDINKDLPSGQPTRLMKGMADSSVFAGKGIGTDYASNMDVMLIGAGVGAGADLHKDKTTNSDLSGAAVAPGAIIGMNLSWMDAKRFMGMDTDRLNVYFNFMSYDLQKNMNNKPGEKSDVDLDMLSLGTHFRYDWIKGSGSKWLGWGGVKFTFGYEYNRNNITLHSQITKNSSDFENTTGPGGETLSGTISGRPVARIMTATHSIPLALSTDVQLLYFLSLYTGLGVDYNWGQSRGKGDLNGSESPITCSGGACGGGQTIKVQPTANINATGRATSFTSRAFAGIQFNLPFIRIFVQADKSLASEVVSATAGVRLVY